MDHIRYHLMIQEYIDGVLPPEQERELEQHLAVCPECAACRRELTRLDSLLQRELFEVEPPVDLVDRVTRALPDVSAAASRRRRRIALTWGSVAAAAVLLAAGVAGLFRSDDVLAPPPLMAFDQQQSDRPELVLPDAPVVAESAPAEPAKDEEAAAPAATAEPDPSALVPTGEPAPQPAPAPAPSTYSSERELPAVASGSQTRGAYSLLTLASVANCDALRPQVEGSLVTFYVNLDGACLQWQVSADGSGNAVFLGECDGLPALPGLGHCQWDENGREYYTAVSHSGAYTAENRSDGLYVNGQLVAAAGGGPLVAWAMDGSKVFFTDPYGSLYLYYPEEGHLLEIASGVSSAVWSGENNIVMSAYDAATGFDSIFRVTVP